MNERSQYYHPKLWVLLLLTILPEAIALVSPRSSPPIIGILSQPSKKRDLSYHYIATSYVDWLEASGAVTIPIPYDAPPELLDDLFPQMNGVLLPGGWNGYMPPSVPYLLDKVVESNERGQYFPVWGTCLGYEFLVKYVGGIDAIQGGFHLYNQSIPLESVRFGELYEDPMIYQTVTEAPVTLNNHQLGIEPEHFLQNEKLTAVWNITSINHDVNGRPFVSTIEPNDPERFPFYGVQYHPEKNGFEYTTYPGTKIPYESIDHSAEGIAFSIYLSQFFVNRVRHGQSVNTEHAYTKPDVYPPISSYPRSTGVKYEDIFIIPYAAHWVTHLTNSTASSMLQANIVTTDTAIAVSSNDSATSLEDESVAFDDLDANLEEEGVKAMLPPSSNIFAAVTLSQSS
jgi:gamma-glutamyl hydrolase